MTSLYPQSCLSLKKGIRYDLLAAGSLYGVTRAGVQELLVSIHVSMQCGQHRPILGHVGRISHFFQHGWRQPGWGHRCDWGRGGVIWTDVFLVAGSAVLEPYLYDTPA